MWFLSNTIRNPFDESYYKAVLEFVPYPLNDIATIIPIKNDFQCEMIFQDYNEFHPKIILVSGFVNINDYYY